MIGQELVAVANLMLILTSMPTGKYPIGDGEVASELSSSFVPAEEYPTSEEGDPMEKARRKKVMEKKGALMIIVVLHTTNEAAI